MTSPTELFPFSTASLDAYPESIKWSRGNSKYEIYLTTLKSTELQHLVPHCLNFRTKVLAAVGNANHQATSLFDVFGRTLSLMLSGVWDQLIADADADPNIDNSRYY